MATERPPPLDDRAREITRRAKQRVGTVIDGKWTLDTLLGVGGMAAVYASTHRNGKKGAVKILHAHEALDPGVKGRFLREGYVANKVDHPGSVSILDDDEAPDGTVYLVMELLEGESLETHCPPGQTMAPGDVLVMMDKLLDVLEAAHEKKIVHRDIKPSNLFLTKEGQLKVLDFGIARIHEIEHSKAQRTTDAALGTPGFMPPEQARGRWEAVDARSDIWAVGATMYTLLTGRWLHDEGTLNEQLVAAMTKPVPKMSTAAPQIPAPLWVVVDRAVAYEKEDRWQTAKDMQQAVREAYESLVGRPISLSPVLRTSGRTSLPDIASQPTVAAPSTGGSGALMRKSQPSGETATAVTTSPPKRRNNVVLVAFGLLGAVAIGSVVVYSRGTTAKPAGTQPTIVESAPIPGASSVPPVATSAQPQPSLFVAATTSSPKLALQPTAMKVKDAGPAASTTPSASATGEVDIFGRRR